MIIENTGGTTIAAGDFTLKHSAWNSTKANPNGWFLDRYAFRSHLSVVVPSNPTHYSTRHSSDILYISLPFDYYLTTITIVRS
jgi:hypothetical protein